MRLDKGFIAEINMGGRGGGEAVFAPALIDFRRVNECLFDFINDKSGERLELKKQQNLQWFDGWKYHNLSADDRNIIMLFVLHNNKKVLKICSVGLGKMIDTLLGDPDYDDAGWSADVLRNLYEIKQKAAKVQSKLPLHVKKFVEKYPNIFSIHYSLYILLTNFLLTSAHVRAILHM